MARLRSVDAVVPEALAMDLERYGDVRVVSVEEITPWKQEVIERG